MGGGVDKVYILEYSEKNLVQELAELINENQIDIAIAAEAENLDISHLLERLMTKRS